LGIDALLIGFAPIILGGEHMGNPLGSVNGCRMLLNF